MEEAIEVCQTCGGGEIYSKIDPLVYCNKCEIVLVHTYCIPPWRKEGDDAWACRDCTMPSTSTSTTIDEDHDALDRNNKPAIRHATMSLTNLTSMLIRILMKGGKLCFGSKSFWKFLPSLPAVKEDIISSTVEYCCHKNDDMDVLPDELLDEILCRLPSSKFVFGCKAVCKRWLTIISSPQFNQRFLSHQHGIQNNHYTDRNSNSVSLLVCSADHKLVKSYLLSPTSVLVNGSSSSRNNWEFSRELLEHFLYKITRVDLGCMEGRVIAVCNDLVLCSQEIWESLVPGGPRQGFLELYLCNAQTKEWIVLPRTRLIENFEAGLICTDVLNAHYRYRVVIVNPRPKFNYQLDAYIYLSETREWKVVVLKVPIIFNLGGYFMNKILVYDGMFVFVNRRHGMVALDPFSEHLLEEEGKESSSIECSFASWPMGYPVEVVSICRGRIRAIFNWCMPSNDILWVCDLVNFNKSEWRCHKYEVGELRDFDLDDHYFSADGVDLLRYFDTDDYTSVKILGAHPLCDDGFFVMTNPSHECWVLYCNLKLKTLELVSKIPEEKFNWGVICHCLVLQPWPTHIPSGREEYTKE